MTHSTTVAMAVSPPRSVTAYATDQERLAERALTVARRTALGVLGDPAAADDIAQEVAIVVLRQAHTLRDEAKADAWLHRIAVRAALKEARRGASRRQAELAGYQRDVRASTPADADGLDGALALLDGLPPRQRAALTLRYVHDLPVEAIAAALRSRETTVRSLLSRGRRSLRDRINDSEVTR